MLQVLLHKKLKDSFENPHFKPSEDSLTSSVMGLIQYLPDDIFWDLLRSSCGRSSNLPESVGAIMSVNFWDRWDATDTRQQFGMERHCFMPDVEGEPKKNERNGENVVRNQ